MITFAFTDIEGSTRLLATLRDRYADVLAEHADLVRATATRWHGAEVDTQGDSFFLVFEQARDAVAFAAELQRGLADHPWPDGVAVRVRVGLHTGEARLARTGYVGIDVHRAARIAAAAHGGQVVISEATRAALATGTDGLTFRDLGQHRLKDMPEPERIHQLEIAGLVAEFPPLRSLDGPEEPPAPGEPPFKGLEAFDVGDADRFFGREALTADLVDHLRRRDFLAIVGASGSGKSSVARAGLMASVRQDPSVLPGGPWTTRVITPTDRPPAELETALAATFDRELPTVLLVDQLEELFTLCDDAGARTAFVESLLGWLASRPGRARVVLTLRADFYDRLADHPRLRDAVAADQRYIGPMSRDELRRAIEEPARLGDWTFVPGLVELLLHDVGDEPGSLPLLSHALLETWDRRSGRMMTLKGYGEAGGVTGAIARTADRVVLDGLELAEQALARAIFLRLTEPGGEGRDTRRRAKLSELVPVNADRPDVDRVVGALVAARLVTLGDDWAEIAHEALIAEWPALREWLDDDREGRRTHRRLTEMAREWTALGLDRSLLARGARLSQLTEWSSGHRAELNADEVAYLEASVALERAEAEAREAQRERELAAARELAEAERRAAVRLRRRAAILAFALVVAVGAMGAAVWQATEAQRQEQVARDQEAAAQAARAEAEDQERAAEQNAAQARSNELAASAIVARDTDPGLARLLALQAVTAFGDPSTETIGVLHETWVTDPVIHRHGWEDGTFRLGLSTDLHPSGTRYSAGGVGRIEVVDVGTEEVAWSVEPGVGTGFGPARHTPDGRWLVAGAVWDPTAETPPGLDDVGLFVWDASTGELVRHIAVGGACGVITFEVSLRNVLVLTFSEATGCLGGPAGLGLIDLDSGALLPLATDVRGFGSAERGALSRDGRYVAFDDLSLGGQHSVVIDTETGQRLLELDTTLAVGQEDSWVRDISDDGRLLLLGDRPIQTIEVATGTVVAGFGGEGGFTNHAEFAPITAGPAALIEYPVLTNGRDGWLRLWDGRWGWQLVAVPAVGSGTISSTEGGLVLAQAYDPEAPGVVSDIALLDLGVRGELGALDGRARGEYWSGEGSFGSCSAAAGSLHAGPGHVAWLDGCNGPAGESSAQVVELGERLDLIHSLPGSTGQVLAVSPDGTRLVRGVGQGFAIGGLDVVDIRTGATLVGLDGPCTWDARPGSQGDGDPCRGYPDEPFPIWADRLHWSPDGSMVAAVDIVEGFHAVWDADDGRRVSDDRSAVFTTDVIFSPGSSRLIVAISDEEGDRLEAWSTETWEVETSTALDLEGRLLTMVGFTADRSILVGMSGAGSLQAGLETLRWFDAETLEEQRAPLGGIHGGSVKATAMSPSGRLVATGASDGTVRVWDAVSGERVHEIRTGDAEVQGLAFLDDERLAVVVRDGSLRVYTLDEQQLIDLVRGSLTRSFTEVECDRYGIDPCPTLDELRGG